MLSPERGELFPQLWKRCRAVKPDLMDVHFSRPELDSVASKIHSSSSSYHNLLPGKGLKLLRSEIKRGGRSQQRQCQLLSPLNAAAGCNFSAENSEDPMWWQG